VIRDNDVDYIVIVIGLAARRRMRGFEDFFLAARRLLSEGWPLAKIGELDLDRSRLLIGVGAVQMGVPLDKFALTVMVLLAALPSASNVSLLAERFGADNGRIARIILVSTAAAFFTFSGAVALITG
jgi:predicted permease